MTQKNGIYKCPLCGNIVEMLHTGAGQLVCCGQNMDLMEENTVDAAKEKHVPVIEKPAPATRSRLARWRIPCKRLITLNGLSSLSARKSIARHWRLAPSRKRNFVLRRKRLPPEPTAICMHSGKTNNHELRFIDFRGSIENLAKHGDGMDKYKCVICGYEYDPALGDPDNGVQPGTSFDDLPDDWVCPVCGATKDDFEKM